MPKRNTKTKMGEEEEEEEVAECRCEVMSLGTANTLPK
jgi:hypothetical protein